MKLITLMTCLLLTITGFSQLDSLSLPTVPDSVEFISKRHLQIAYKNLQTKLKPMEGNLTVTQYRSLVEGIEAAFNEAVIVASQDYRKRKPRK